MEKVILPTKNNEHQVFDLDNIIYFEGKDCYSIVYFKDRSTLTSGSSLKTIESKVQSRYLFRINRQTVVNLKHLTKHRTTESKLTLVFSDDHEFTLARNRIQAFKERLSELYDCL
jgi:DNA-binding LytR/AlgR family response regulator